MPRGQPFTRLCQITAKLARPRRADLHVHTTTSDGDFTPSQIIFQARDADLSAIAIADHDTTHGLAEALETAASLSRKALTLVPGVEISTSFRGQSFHLLGYGFEIDHPVLQAGLAAIRRNRRDRFER
jgi:predicted metal-dependent phosphoesterase TrpH